MVNLRHRESELLCSFVAQFLDISIKIRNLDPKVEYEALLAGLDLAWEVGALRIRCHTNSQLVAKHVKGTYQVKDSLLLRYYHRARTTLQRFDKSEVQQVPCANNFRTNILARLGHDQGSPHRIVLHRTLSSLVVDRPKILHVEAEYKEWMSPIWNYLEHDTSPKDKGDAAKIRQTTS
ncbi:hypothetical protein CR513_40382, partial [Mucuna pruriens]